MYRKYSHKDARIHDGTLYKHLMTHQALHECHAVHILNLGSHEMVVGQIEEIYATDSCLTNGEPDVTKIKPFLWVGRPTDQYWEFGKPIGEAHSIGKQVKG